MTTDRIFRGPNLIFQGGGRRIGNNQQSVVQTETENRKYTKWKPIKNSLQKIAKKMFLYWHEVKKTHLAKLQQKDFFHVHRSHDHLISKDRLPGCDVAEEEGEDVLSYLITG